MRTNEEIKRTLGFYGIKQWELAKEVGVGEDTMSRWLRTELTEERKKRVQEAIDSLSTRNA